MKSQTVHLGFEIGTGKPVEIPLAHTFVTGQTQLSGKTTALRAIVERSKKRALAFITKRGEQFAGRRIRPYLPREGEKPIHWRLVETILASALGQRAMKYERFQIINAAKGARSLVDVRRNCDRLRAKAKNSAGEIYELLGEYLDLVLPEMRDLNAADTLDLQPGLNVMDLTGCSGQLQALVIRAALERINQHETGVLTVFPEAWEFAPRGRSAPAKDEAIAMARKGAVLGNFLLSDSQDIAGVDTTIRQAASVWILGVQRELNELKRAIDSIPHGIAKPKSAAMATLELGQFFACWGTHAIKTYVQPSWCSPERARAVALGEIPATDQHDIERSPGGHVDDTAAIEAEAESETRTVPTATIVEDEPLTDEDDMPNEQLEALNDKLDKLIGAMSAGAAPEQKSRGARHEEITGPSNGDAAGGENDLFERFRDRLMKDPKVIRILQTQPRVEVEVKIETIKIDGKSLPGRIAYLVKNRFFQVPKKQKQVYTELERTGPAINYGNASRELKRLVALGFLTIESDGYREVSSMAKNVV